MIVSPHTHCESFLTSSTLSNLVERACELKREYFTCTDHGYLHSSFKAYSVAKKAKLKPILGIELFFKDPVCPVVSGTRADRCRYFSLTVYAVDQEAYQAICRIVSRTDFQIIEIREEKQNLFTWKDLEELSKYNIQVVLGGVHCVVGKAFLASDANIGLKLFEKLHALFQNKLSVAIIAEPWQKKFAKVVEIRYVDNTRDSILASDTVTTDRARKIKAQDLIDRPGHTEVISKVVGGIYTEVGKGIESIKLHTGFLPLSCDVTLKINKFLVLLAKRYNVPILVSDYSYYANRDDRVVQDIVLEGKDRIHSHFHMKTGGEILDYLEKTMGLSPQEATQIIDNNTEWAKNFYKFELKYEWRLASTEGQDPLKKAMEIIKRNGRMKWDNKIYVDRLRMELEIIAKNGIKDLTPYFLPIVEIMDHYKEQGHLTSVGRGSAGASLFCFLLGITNLDPIRFDLPFNRFFSKTRIEMRKLPDIDTDMPQKITLTGEDGKSGFLFKRWGNCAGIISTRQTLRLRSAIKDVERYFNGSVSKEVERFVSGLPLPPQGVNDQHFVFGYESEDGEHVPGIIETNEDLQKYAKNNPRNWEIVSKAMGITRAFSKHACATVLSDISIDQVMPVKDGYVTHYEHKDVEQASLVKYDFLTIGQLLDIEICLGLINKKNGDNFEPGYFRHNGVKTYIWDLPEERSVFESVWDGNTVSLFQINSTGMSELVQQIQPTRLEDITAILALERPGPKDYRDPETGLNMVEEYLLRRKGESKPDIKELADILPDTYGVMCVKKGSKVKTKDGLINIEDVKIGSLVQTEDGSYQKVLDNIYKGKKETIKIRLDNSEELEVTPDHKVLTAMGWKEAKDLTNRDLIKHFWASDEKIEEGNDKDWIVGLLLADGNLCGTTIEICIGNNRKIADFVKPIVDKEFGLKDKDCYNKEFPSKVTKKMIEGFIEGDGCLINQRVRLKNERLARRLFMALQALRIKSSIYLDKEEVWTVSFERDKLNFKFKNHDKHDHNKGLFYPKPDWYIPRWDDDLRQYFYPKRKRTTPFVSSHLLDKIMDKYPSLVYDKTQTWSKVLRIRNGNVNDVYDLSIENNHSFVVGGNVVHNCFQEDLGKIAKQLAGFTDEDAELLRENMAKKKMVELTKIKPLFISGAIKKVSQEVAEKIWEQMVTFGRYGFSIVHSWEYAMITYACMFLRHNYKLDWWSAVLSNAEEKEITGKFWKYSKELIAPPDINLSSDIFVPDYKTGKIRAKLGVIRGMGENTIEPIVASRPYKDIQDFVNKDVAGPSLTHKLIHVGVLDSLFKENMSLEEKLKSYEDAVQIKRYQDKKAKADASGKKVKLTQPKAGSVPESYVNLHPMKDAAMKKSVLPTMYVDLYSLGAKYSKAIDKWSSKPKVIDPKFNKSVFLVDGNTVERLDKLDSGQIENDIYVAATGYVIEAKEFDYHKGTKRALKMIVACDNYISEKILWPDYDTQTLIYPKELTKGSIITLFLRKRANKGGELNVTKFIVES